MLFKPYLINSYSISVIIYPFASVVKRCRLRETEYCAFYIYNSLHLYYNKNKKRKNNFIIVFGVSICIILNLTLSAKAITAKLN